MPHLSLPLFITASWDIPVAHVSSAGLALSLGCVDIFVLILTTLLILQLIERLFLDFVLLTFT